MQRHSRSLMQHSDIISTSFQRVLAHITLLLPKAVRIRVGNQDTSPGNRCRGGRTIPAPAAVSPATTAIASPPATTQDLLVMLLSGKEPPSLVHTQDQPTLQLASGKSRLDASFYKMHCSSTKI